jgi:methylated-DNA-[protein]-cysteine S-methyltransferase
MKIETLVDSMADEFGDAMVEEILRDARRGLDRALERFRRPQAALGVVKSPLGDLLVAITSRGVVLNHYLRDAADLAAAIAQLRLHFDLVEDRRAAEEIGEELRRYVGGDGAALRHPVDLALAQSAFQKKVLTKLLAVPRGAVISYLALGAAAGAPHAARAVGNAMHNNPVPVYVPCHRVIASDGGIGGYGGGLPRKLQLLRAEGFALGDSAATIPADAVLGYRSTGIYCRRGCRAGARAHRTRLIFFAGPQHARKAGLRPCKLCRPG